MTYMNRDLADVSASICCGAASTAANKPSQQVSSSSLALEESRLKQYQQPGQNHATKLSQETTSSTISFKQMWQRTKHQAEETFLELINNWLTCITTSMFLLQSEDAGRPEAAAWKDPLEPCHSSRGTNFAGIRFKKT